jgi:hypothetical protein
MYGLHSPGLLIPLSRGEPLYVQLISQRNMGAALTYFRGLARGFYFSGAPKTLQKVPPKKTTVQKALKGVFFRSAGPRRGVGGRSDLRFLSVCDLNKKKLCFFL